MKFRSLTGAAAVLAVLLAAPGCLMIMDPDMVDDQEPNREYHQTVDFKPGGSLTLRNDLGTIRIFGADRQDLDVKATWRFPNQDHTQVALYGMGSVKPEVKTDPQKSLVSIRSVGSDWPGKQGQIDFTLTTPSSVNLKEIRQDRGDIEVADLYGQALLSLGHGNIKVGNFSGPIDISIDEGSAQVEELDLRPGDVVRINIGSGNIDLFLEGSAGVSIEAVSDNGTVESEFAVEGKKSVSSLAGEIGKGGAKITLHTGRGYVKIRKIQEQTAS